MYFSTREEAISYLVNHQRGPIDYSWRSPARSYTYNISPTAITSDISIMAKILKFRDIDTQELDDEIRAIMSEFNNKYAKAFSDTAYAMDYSRADKNFLALYKVGLSKAGYPIIEYNANIDYKEDFSDWCDDDIDMRVRLVKDFDRACDKIIARILWWAENADIATITETVTVTRTILKPREGT